MKYLVLKGCAGLGNRLISLMKAIEYCKDTNRTLFVDWDDGMFSNKGENAFYSLFELHDVPYIKDKQEILDFYKSGCSCYPTELRYEELEKDAVAMFKVVTPHISRFIPYKYFGNWLFRGKLTYIMGLQSLQRTGNGVSSYFDVLKNINKGDNMPMGGVLSKKSKEDIVLFYDARPIVNIKKINHYIRPNKEIMTLIDEFSVKYNLNECVGVHVRYTDKKPLFFLSKLYKMMDKLIMENPTQKIFLCTDNNDIVEAFKQKYGDNVFQIEKFLPDTGGQGIHDYARAKLDYETKRRMAIECIMDMWLLSKCKVLYWQGNSSFSYISKYIKDDPKSTINWMSIW